MEPEPRQVLGVNTTLALLGKHAYTVNEGIMQIMRINGATVINAVNEIGWEKYLAAMEKKQGPVSTALNAKFVKELGVKTHTCFDIRLLNGYTVLGGGFFEKGGGFVEFSDKYEETVMNWCPQVQANYDMGFTEPFDFDNWCDVYNLSLARALNPNVQYVHVNCPQRGDKCHRGIIEYCKDKEPILNYDRKEGDKGESIYQKITRHKNEKRAALKKLPEWAPSVPFMVLGQNFGSLSNLSIEEIERLGAKLNFKTCIGSVLVAGDTLGWEKFINLIGEKQSWGWTQAADNRRLSYGILGHTLRDAAALVVSAYAGLPFDSHRLTKYTDEQIEGIADWCPIVEQANEMKLDKLEDLSLWCDFYHNFDVHAANPEFQQVHTHCLGRGDKYCRFVIDK